MLPKGHKGMLIDGDFRTWRVDRTGFPHHDEVQEKYFMHMFPDVRATHWFDGTLNIDSYADLFSDETKIPINAFYGNRGSFSKMFINSSSGNFEGAFRDYQEAERRHEAAEPARAWIRSNCRFSTG